MMGRVYFVFDCDWDQSLNSYSIKFAGRRVDAAALYDEMKKIDRYTGNLKVLNLGMYEPNLAAGINTNIFKEFHICKTTKPRHVEIKTKKFKTRFKPEVRDRLQ